jgi:hypothetical protein
MLDFAIDIEGLEQLAFKLKRELPNELAAVAQDLGEDGERLVGEALDLLIYSQPERGYERTGKLRESAYGYGRVTPNGFEVVLGAAVGGADGRSYAEYVDRGTYDSRIDRDRLLADARAESSFSPRAYPRGKSGLEARAFSEAAIAEVERRLEDRVLEAVDRVGG